MNSEPAIAFAAPAGHPGLEIRVNFGVFAGREATPAEIDLLAQSIIPKVGPISIVSEQRHQISDHAEALLHQVRIEIPDDRLPAGTVALERLADELVKTAEAWTEDCVSQRHADEVDL
ncbi:MAG: hypothetical protein H0U03_03770 [Actinobacteria bacterium]|nr:hypothetical protein [Actinomycetota bacterium]